MAYTGQQTNGKYSIVLLTKRLYENDQGHDALISLFAEGRAECLDPDLYVASVLSTTILFLFQGFIFLITIASI